MIGFWRGRVDDGFVCVKIRDVYLFVLYIMDFDFIYGVYVCCKRVLVEFK